MKKLSVKEVEGWADELYSMRHDPDCPDESIESFVEKLLAQAREDERRLIEIERLEAWGDLIQSSKALAKFVEIKVKAERERIDDLLRKGLYVVRPLEEASKGDGWAKCLCNTTAMCPIHDAPHPPQQEESRGECNKCKGEGCWICTGIGEDPATPDTKETPNLPKPQLKKESRGECENCAVNKPGGVIAATSDLKHCAVCGRDLFPEDNFSQTEYYLYISIRNSVRCFYYSKNKLSEQDIKNLPEWAWVADSLAINFKTWLNLYLKQRNAYLVQEARAGIFRKVEKARKYAVLPDPNPYGKYVSVTNHNRIVNQVLDGLLVYLQQKI